MISVIVTTYNRKKLLKETINSILCQTYEDFELIVVDNYSDYDFMEFMKSFGSEKVRAFQNNNNGIIAVNRNFGIKKSKGDYIAFCDDDDLWMKNKLELQMKYIQEKGCDFISTGLLYFGKKGVSGTVHHPYKNRFEAFLKNNVTPSTVLVKNTSDVRFSEDPRINGAEDWELFARLIIMGYKLYQIPDALVKYRIFDNTSDKIKIQPHLRAIMVLKILKRTCGKKIKLSQYILAIIYHLFFYFMHKIGFVKLIKFILKKVGCKKY